MASVELQGLTKLYNKRPSVEALSLSIRDRESLVLFGQAGAGKTTALNLIAGIVKPDSGSVKIGGLEVTSLKPSDRNVAMVFERCALYSGLSVYENMAFPLRGPRFKLSEEKIREQVTQLAGAMRIDHLLRSPIKALSEGQRQLTALGRAFVRNADVHLLDEPLDKVDASLQHVIRAELKEMRSRLARTTIHATHDVIEAMSLGDRVAVLNDGRVIQCAVPDEIYFCPATVHVARLFGDPEVNILDARPKSAGGSQLSLQMLGENIPLPLPPDVAQVLNERSASRVQAGIRPADVRIAREGDKQAFHATIHSFEPLGSKSLLTLRAVDGSSVRVLVDGHLSFEMDRRTQFRIDPHCLMIFEAESQKFLARSAESMEIFKHG